MRNLNLGYLIICLLCLACNAKTQETISNDHSSVSTARSVDIPEDVVDITGDWEITASTPRGNRSIDLQIFREGQSLKGQIGDEQFPIKMEGENISWAHTLDTPRGKMDALFDGAVKDVNTLKGTISLPSGPSIGRKAKWTANRKKS